MNNLIDIPLDNVIFEFPFNNNFYAVISENSNPSEGDIAYLAQVIVLDDGTKVLRNIESDEEYAKVENEYNRLSNELGGEE